MTAEREMKTKKRRLIEIAAGAALTAFVAALVSIPAPLFETIHNKLYDVALTVRGPLKPHPEIAVVAIDDASLAKIGRWPWPRAKTAELIERLSQAGARIIALDIVFLKNSEENNGDEVLAETIKRAGNVLLPFYFKLGAAGPNVDKERESHLSSSVFLLFDDPNKFADFPPLTAEEIFAPPPAIAKAARALGHINVVADADGKVRRDPLIVEHAGAYYPSFSLQIASAASGLSMSGLTVRVGESIRLAEKHIPMDQHGMMILNYHGAHQTFVYHPAADVLSGKAGAEAFKNRIVLAGITAAGTSSGIQDLMAQPFSNRFFGVEKHAHEVASILSGRFLSRPAWAPAAELAMILFIGALLTMTLPRTGPAVRLLFCLILLAALIGLSVAAIFQGVWIKILFPGLLTVLLFLASAAFIKRPAREAAPAIAAATVYAPTTSGDATIRLEAPAAVRKIGRYEIVGELGRGAMGVVYKGRDPIIDRWVAVKTIRFDKFYEEQEIQNLKERFFKEAKAAGKLVHPNIVTVFDVGDEEGLSFIAMEYIEGQPLSKYTLPESLMPCRRAISLLIETAEALHFAHERGIVHRDVKPANIMVTPDGNAKVMDFGIAKLPASTLTNAGAVLGTPSYMSPEQINGREVDGRTDIFSLGCVLYELVTGEKPFKAENLPALSFQICREAASPPSRLNLALDPRIDDVIAKALAKEPQLRFPNGREMAEALSRILAASDKDGAIVDKAMN